MRIVVSEFMSLDGVVQAPGGPRRTPTAGSPTAAGRCRSSTPRSMGAAIGEGMATTEALLFGRRTWQVMAEAWPERAGDPFADQMNAIPKYVVSSTLTDDDIDWNGTSLIPADGAIDAIAELRARDGGDLPVMGSATLARALLAAGLVDELNLMIEPVILGGGKRLFPDDGRLARSSWSTTPSRPPACRSARTARPASPSSPATATSSTRTAGNR